MAPFRNTTNRIAKAWNERAVALKAISYALVGGVNIVVDASVFFLALGYFKLSLIAANVFAWLIAVSGSYVMNSFITFAAESGRKLRWRDYGAFVALGVAGFAANTTTLIVAAMFMSVWVAKVLAILVSFLVNFSLSYFIVFGRSERPTPEPR